MTASPATRRCSCCSIARGSGAEGYVPPDPDRTTVDHVAFGIHRDDFEAEAERLEGLGYDLDYAYHDWVEWRSLYLPDPGENSVELVCHDPA